MAAGLLRVQAGRKTLLAVAGTDAGVDAILEVETGDRGARFAVQAKSRAPYPYELERPKQSWHGLAARGIR